MTPRATAGLLTADKIVHAAFLRGRGLTHQQIAQRLDVRNVNDLCSVLRAHGVPETGRPGMREIRIELSHARYADAAAMTRQAGYELEAGLTEFLTISAKDRTIRETLNRKRSA